MSLYVYILIPVFSILISFAAIIAVMLSLKNKKQDFFNQIIDEFSPEKNLAFLNSGGEISSEIEGQIDNRLNAVIIGFKKQIPMIGMFLSQTKENELKETAKTELLKLVPGIKDRFIKKANEIFKPVNGSSEGLLALKLNKILDALWKKIKYKIILTVFVVGLIFGFIELGIVYLLASLN